MQFTRIKAHGSGQVTPPWVCQRCAHPNPASLDRCAKCSEKRA